MMVILGPLAALTTSAVTVTLASLPASLVTVEPSTSEQRREVDAVAGLAAHLVDDEDVADGHLLLATASANNRVHVELTLLGRTGWGATLGTGPSTRARWAHRGIRLRGRRPGQQTRRPGCTGGAAGGAGRRHDAGALAPPRGGRPGRRGCSARCLGVGRRLRRLGALRPARLRRRLGVPATGSASCAGSASLRRLGVPHGLGVLRRLGVRAPAPVVRSSTGLAVGSTQRRPRPPAAARPGVASMSSVERRRRPRPPDWRAAPPGGPPPRSGPAVGPLGGWPRPARPRPAAWPWSRPPRPRRLRDPRPPSPVRRRPSRCRRGCRSRHRAGCRHRGCRCRCGRRCGVPVDRVGVDDDAAPVAVLARSRRRPRSGRSRPACGSSGPGRARSPRRPGAWSGRGPGTRAGGARRGRGCSPAPCR